MSFVIEGVSAALANELTAGAREVLPYIVHGVHAGLSANAIGRALQGAGQGINRNSLLTAVRFIRSNMEGAAYQRGLAPSEFPDPRLFRVGKIFLKNPYEYVVQVHGTNARTGAPEVRHITVGNSSPLSNDSLEEYIQAVLDAGYNTYELEMDSYDVTDVLVDPRVVT